jgi:hypothetical protein
LKAIGKGIENTFVAFFGSLYWVVYYIIYAIGWIITYVPRKIGEILLSIGGGIAKVFKELWVYISPKSMG